MALAKRRFRPMGFGDILDEAFDLYKNNFVLLVGIAAFVYAPYYFLYGWSMAPFLAALTKAFPTAGPPSPATIQEVSGMGGAASWVSMLFWIAYGIVTGTFMYAISQRYLDEPTSIGKSYGFVLSRAGALLLTLGLLGIVLLAMGLAFSMVMGVLMFAAAAATFATAAGGAAGGALGVLLAVPVALAGAALGLCLAVRLLFAVPALILEGKRYFGALGRAWALSAGYSWRILGIMLVTWIVVGLIALIAMGAASPVILPALRAGNTAAAGALIGVVAAIVEVLLAPVASIVLILLYYDLRIRKEGFDLQMLARDLAAASGQPLTEQSSQPSADTASAPSPAPSDAPRCAYCRFLIYKPEESTTCSSCGAVFHASCWAERKGCTTPGCPAAPAGGQQP